MKLSRSQLARELGKLGAGKPKTMTPEAIEQRRNAAKSRESAKKSDKTSQESLHNSVTASV